MRELISKIRFFIKSEVFRYLFFGGLTTIVSLGSYFLAALAIGGGNELTGLQVQVANIISWIFAVSFAYITNKLWVFNSRSTDIKVLFREITSFVSARIFSLVVEAGWLFLSVELLNINDFIAKVIGQFVVVVLNYIFSKLFIFKKTNIGGNNVEE